MGEVSVSKMIPVDAMKVLADALEEFRSMMDDNFVMEEFEVKLSTGYTPDEGLQITAKLHPERSDEFVLEFE